MKWVRRAAAGVAVLAALFAVLLFVFQRDLLFPRQMVRVPQVQEVAGRETLWLPGDVEAWFLPGAGVSATQPGPMLIFAHGNAELIDHWPSKLQPYRDRGVSVLLVEYRGYGRSGGEPSEAGIVEDYVRAYDLAVARPEVDAQRVVLHGRSLGGGVVCGLARERPPAGMILQSTFTSVPDAAPWWAPRFLARDHFDNLGCVAGYDGPLLVIHGRTDTLIPLAHAEQLVAASDTAELFLYDGGHNDSPPKQEYRAALDRFVSAATGR